MLFGLLLPFGQWAYGESRVQKKLRYVVYIFEHELNELNEFFIKTCDSKIIRVIRIIRVQKNISGLYMLGVVL